ncbi:MAG: GNAT family N-acetyltransferase [Asgard group archaeon]|nr:GNAT family N-acetyltransferase [Asgard group archaeon]
MIENLDFYIANLDDLVSIFKIIDITGWGETIQDIENVLKNPNNTYVTVVDRISGEMVGITLAVSYGTIGFIGHVIVLPKYRGMGIGKELMIEAINHLQFSGCKTIKLDAVDKALSLYERVGFIFELNSLRYQYEITETNTLEKLILQLKLYDHEFAVFNTKEDDLVDIFNADKKFFGADREVLLQTFFDEYPELAFIIKDANDLLVGYSFGSYQNGILKIRSSISDSVNTTANLILAAISSLKADKNLKSIKIGILENNKYGLQTLEELGFIKTSFSLRMYWGEKTSATTHPGIFAIGDPAKG